MPARQRSAPAPEPITKDEKHSEPDASSPEANSVKGATKKDIKLWHGVIQMVETQIAKETNINRVENMRAVLGFIQEHGYPDGDKCEEGNPEFCIWAMDGEVMCQTAAEFMADPRWSLSPPGFKGRCNDGYAVVSKISMDHSSLGTVLTSLFRPLHAASNGVEFRRSAAPAIVMLFQSPQNGLLGLKAKGGPPTAVYAAVWMVESGLDLGRSLPCMELQIRDENSVVFLFLSLATKYQLHAKHAVSAESPTEVCIAEERLSSLITS